MKRKNNRGGFTLVELLVVILIGSVITLAAVTILLLGLRVNHRSGEVVTRQNTVRILLSAMEDVIAEGTVTKIEAGPESWVVYGEGEAENTPKTLFSYSSTLCTISTGGAAILEDVIASHISQSGDLITVSVETEDGSYTSSVYCRKGISVEGSTTPGDSVVGNLTDAETNNDNVGATAHAAARTEFLKILASQYKLKDGSPNPGLILKEGYSTGEYYARWYESTWPADTAWCVCYVSWALAETGEMKAPADWPNWFANTEYFKDYITEKEKTTTPKGWIDGGATPQPGDLIFFDWNGDGETQHIGAVLTVATEDNTGYVYTIEGNSANRVAVRKYALNDERIDGYCDFSWLLTNHPVAKQEIADHVNL